MSSTFDLGATTYTRHQRAVTVYGMVSDELCSGCPAITTIKGVKGSYGEPMDEDDTTCPLNFEPELVIDDCCLSCACRDRLEE